MRVIWHRLVPIMFVSVTWLSQKLEEHLGADKKGSLHPMRPCWLLEWVPLTGQFCDEPVTCKNKNTTEKTRNKCEQNYFAVPVGRCLQR